MNFSCFNRKKSITIGEHKLKLDLSNPHEQRYYDSIKNDDYFLAKSLISKGDYVLDLGANIGFTALLYLSFGAAKVYAVEPLPQLADRIKKIKTKGINIFNCAVSDHMGKAEIFLSDSHNQGHSLNSEWPKKWKEVFSKNDRTEVDVKTLDAMFPTEIFNFIKIDIEGSETKAIKGGANFFRRNTDAVVQIEIYDWQLAETHEALSSYYKYVYLPVMSGNIIQFEKIDPGHFLGNHKFSGPPNYIYTNNTIS